MPRIERFQELFGEGFRDVSDDGERLALYIWGAIALALSAAGAFSEIVSFYEFHHGIATAYVWADAILTAAAIVISIVIFWFFAKESRHWDLKQMSAEKLVAGGMLSGAAVLFLTFELVRGSRAGNKAEIGGVAVVGIALGSALCLISLFVGLLFAAAEKIQERPRKLPSILIERRYALDSNLIEHENHPCPWEDDMQGFLICRTADGKSMKLSANPSAYDLADPGKIGSAVVRGMKVSDFHPK